MGQMADELYTQLDQAGEAGPYLLVGHSWGGGVTRLFAARHPEQVAGLVWIEATHPDAWSRRALPESTFGGIPQEQIAAIPFMARLGVFRIFPALLGGWGVVPGLPAEQQAELTAYFNTTKWADTVVAVEGALPLSLAQLRSAGDLGNVPLTIIAGTASGEADQIGQELQSELAALSTNSKLVWVEGADHSSLVHVQADANLTASAILDALESIREP
jgi:pimeloyl-ACP methyl ester carboxylesterase